MGAENSGIINGNFDDRTGRIGFEWEPEFMDTDRQWPEDLGNVILYLMDGQVEDYTPQDAYLDHVRHIEGPDAEPKVPFDELSDMAVQMYEAEAAIVNAQPGAQSGE